MLRKGVCDLVPHRLGTDKDVFARHGAWVIIHGSDYYFTNHAGMCIRQ